MLTRLETKSERFTGTIEPFAVVDIAPYVRWLLSIPESEWHGMNDMSWHNWGDKFKPLAQKLIDNHYPGCYARGHMLFMVEAGRVHERHTDEQAPGWLTRIHVPIVTNPYAATFMDDGPHTMHPALAYRFNTFETHAIVNLGVTPRVHFIFDVGV